MSFCVPHRSPGGCWQHLSRALADDMRHRMLHSEKISVLCAASIAWRLLAAPLAGPCGRRATSCASPWKDKPRQIKIKVAKCMSFNQSGCLYFAPAINSVENRKYMSLNHLAASILPLQSTVSKTGKTCRLIICVPLSCSKLAGCPETPP